MSRKNVLRATLGGAVVIGALLIAAVPAMANDSTDGPEGAGGGSSEFTRHQPPSAANDLTPGGVPVFGAVDSVRGAPQRVIPGAGGNGSY